MGHLARETQRKRDGEARSLGKRHDRVDDRLHSVRLELASAYGAERAADSSPEKSEIVVDLRRGSDRRARRLRGVLLLDRYGGGEAIDRVDVGLLHAIEKLPRVRRQRLHVAALALGVDRVECERGFP